MTPKPILIARIPKSEITLEQFQQICYQMDRRMEGYNTIVMLSKVEEAQFEVLNSQDATDVNIQELRKMVYDYLQP